MNTLHLFEEAIYYFSKVSIDILEFEYNQPLFKSNNNNA